MGATWPYWGGLVLGIVVGGIIDVVVLLYAVRRLVRPYKRFREEAIAIIEDPYADHAPIETLLKLRELCARDYDEMAETPVPKIPGSAGYTTEDR